MLLYKFSSGISVFLLCIKILAKENFVLAFTSPIMLPIISLFASCVCLSVEQILTLEQIKMSEDAWRLLHRPINCALHPGEKIQ